MEWDVLHIQTDGDIYIMKRYLLIASILLKLLVEPTTFTTNLSDFIIIYVMYTFLSTCPYYVIDDPSADVHKFSSRDASMNNSRCCSTA